MLDRKISDIIGKQDLVRLSADATITDAVKKMADRRIGAILVCDERGLAGIFTERDVVHKVVSKGIDPASTTLADVMTANPISVHADDTGMDALRAMKNNTTRHLPVIRGSDVEGIVTVRDLLRSVVDELDHENRFVEEMWDGVPV